MHHNSGFTLIETIIYMALLSVIITTGLVSAYNLFSESQGYTLKTALDQEGSFVIQKIENILNQTENIVVPNESFPESEILSVDLYDMTTLTTVQYNKTNKSVEVWRSASSGFISLTKSKTNVSELKFIYLKSGSRTGLKIRLAIDGNVWEEIFYLKK